MTRFILWFAPHIKQWAIIYVFVCYGIFTVLNLTVLDIDMDDPYGIAMILIASFWITVLKIFDILDNMIRKGLERNES